MGAIIQARMFSPKNQAGLLKPIIFCCRYEAVEEQAVSVNVALAKELLKFSEKRRTMQIEKCFGRIISKLPENPVIKDFDVLFNPDYKIDVMNIMVNACKVKPFSIIWPGRLEDNKLIYAEEGFRDYKVYDIRNYDVTCIR